METEFLTHLETFAAAAERGGFSAAARHLGLSQSAISQRIQQLEVLLKTTLFLREGGRAILTESGRRLHEYARRILDLAEEARRAVTGRTQDILGELLIAASSVPGQYLLPHALAAFRKRYPLVEVRVSVSDTEAALHQVEQGSASIGFVGGPGGSHLEFRLYSSDELVLVVPKRHPWWRKRSVTAAELSRQPLVQREKGSASRRRFEQSLEQAGTRPSALNVVLELSSSEAIKGAVLEGMGVAVLSRLAVRSEVRAGTLKPLRVEGLELGRDISIVWDRRRVLPATARVFLDLVGTAVPPRHP
jgi:DNA-binding transcriptional LysR family regulator